KRLQQCNWAHSVEGALDTAHFSFLHMPAPSVETYVNPATAPDASRLRWLRDDPMPQFTIIEHDVGFALGGPRPPGPGDSYGLAPEFMVRTDVSAASAMPGEFFQC